MFLNLPRISVLSTLLMTGIAALPPTGAYAQRGLKDVPDPDPAKQQASFQVAEGFAINLFAAEPMIAKPIQMNWDTQGRLWVATSETYPQIKPGQAANDKIVVLEDTNGDGVADKQTVFAEGLLMPTAILPGDGGVYVGASTELLHLMDTDGDGKADRKRIVLSGFGTEDTHHMIHTLRRGPTGHIYFNQSIYTHSHLETPFGAKRLLAGGTWKMNPHTIELEVYTRGLVNPWGLAFNEWGQSFETDGAGSEGIHYVFPEIVMFTAHNAERTVRGLNPGQPKHCGLELLSGDHLPPGWSGRYVTNDFRGNRINSFELSPSGSGYVSVQADNLLSSNYVSFRPIDILMGPDGAIYVADWYNPIIQHGEVDFRDERRDHEHGRIWRIAPVGHRPPARKVPADSDRGELFTLLTSPEKWWRDAARTELASRVDDALRQEALQWTSRQVGQSLLEGLWLLSALGSPDPAQIDRALTDADPRLRAAAVRLMPEAFDATQSLSRLEQAVSDAHPQVRLEAVHGLRRLASPEALLLCTRALAAEQDVFLDFALWRTFRETEGIWLPELLNNPRWQELSATVLIPLAKAARSPAVLDPVLARWRAGKIPPEQSGEVLNLVAQQGQPEHVQALWNMARAGNEQTRPPLLKTLVTLSERRNLSPAEDREQVRTWLIDADLPTRELACQLAGWWKLQNASQELRTIVTTASEPVGLRAQAITALARLEGQQPLIRSVAKGEQLPELRLPALEALAAVELNLAARTAVEWLGQTSDPSQVDRILNPFLSRKQGPDALTRALAEAQLPTEVAIIGVRRAGSLSPRNEKLISAFQKAGNLEPVAQGLSPEEYQALAAAVLRTGNMRRGEQVYRRENLQCLKCHAIGGAGGKVGPDLTSIGASAPVDYLIESLIEPNKKIKEGYHTLQIVTVDGLVKTGVPVLQNQQEVHLRNAEGIIEVIATEDIELSRISPTSLMPGELVSKLPRDELIDLTRFLSALGKTGELVVSRQRYVRTWDVLNPGDQIAAVTDAIRHNGPAHATGNDAGLPWKTDYSFVEGQLPVSSLAMMRNVDGLNLQFARFYVEVITAGEIGFQIEQPLGLRLWVGQQEVTAGEQVRVELPAGRHRVTVAVEPAVRQHDLLRIELIDLPGSTGQAQLVN